MVVMACLAQWVLGTVASRAREMHMYGCPGVLGQVTEWVLGMDTRRMHTHGRHAPAEVVPLSEGLVGFMHLNLMC